MSRGHRGTEEEEPGQSGVMAGKSRECSRRDRTFQGSSARTVQWRGRGGGVRRQRNSQRIQDHGGPSDPDQRTFKDVRFLS